MPISIVSSSMRLVVRCLNRELPYLIGKQESVYCSLTKMRKIIPTYFTAYARLVTKTFGCAWSGLKLLWMHPQAL